MTAWVLGGVILALLAWEAFTLSSATDDHDTITQVTRKAVKRWPVIAFLAGVLCGHLFWC